MATLEEAAATLDAAKLLCTDACATDETAHEPHRVEQEVAYAEFSRLSREAAGPPAPALPNHEVT